MVSYKSYPKELKERAVRTVPAGRIAGTLFFGYTKSSAVDLIPRAGNLGKPASASMDGCAVFIIQCNLPTSILHPL